MSHIPIRGAREAQVFQLLQREIALSTKGIMKLSNHPVEKRRMLRVLKRLCEKKLIKRYFDTQFGGNGVFYALTKEHRAHEVGIPKQLHHWEACSLWIAKIRALLPDTIIIRDRDFNSCIASKEALLWDGIDREVIPDFLVFVPSKVEKRNLAIAFEIERFYKSESRIFRKLKRYSRGTNLDGVIYVSPDDSVPYRVKSIFDHKIVDQSDRINGYRNYFLLVSSDLAMDCETFEPTSLNSKSIDFMRWCKTLTLIHRYERRDENFETSHSGG